MLSHQRLPPPWRCSRPTPSTHGRHALRAVEPSAASDGADGVPSLAPPTSAAGVATSDAAQTFTRRKRRAHTCTARPVSADPPLLRRLCCVGFSGTAAATPLSRLLASGVLAALRRRRPSVARTHTPRPAGMQARTRVRLTSGTRSATRRSTRKPSRTSSRAATRPRAPTGQ